MFNLIMDEAFFEKLYMNSVRVKKKNGFWKLFEGKLVVVQNIF